MRSSLIGLFLAMVHVPLATALNHDATMDVSNLMVPICFGSEQEKQPVLAYLAARQRQQETHLKIAIEHLEILKNQRHDFTGEGIWDGEAWRHLRPRQRMAVMSIVLSLVGTEGLAFIKQVVIRVIPTSTLRNTVGAGVLQSANAINSFVQVNANSKMINTAASEGEGVGRSSISRSHILVHRQRHLDDLHAQIAAIRKDIAGNGPNTFLDIITGGQNEVVRLDSIAEAIAVDMSLYEKEIEILAEERGELSTPGAQVGPGTLAGNR